MLFLVRRYPRLSEDEIARICPCCRGNCNCKACLRRNVSPEVGISNIVLIVLHKCHCFLTAIAISRLSQDTVYLGVPKDENKKVQQLKYLVQVLYPYLKQFDHEQVLEMETEANTQGTSCTLVLSF